MLNIYTLLALNPVAKFRIPLPPALDWGGGRIIPPIPFHCLENFTVGVHKYHHICFLGRFTWVSFGTFAFQQK